MVLMKVTNEYLLSGDLTADPDSLRLLYQSAPSEIRCRLAENPNCPQDILRLLVEDSDPEVRASLVHNPNVGREILERLCNDRDVDVRASIAEEPRLPFDLLSRMADDVNPYVKDIAESTLDGLSFERELSHEGYVHEVGSTARLGELLVQSQVLDGRTLEQLLELASSTGKPLGQLIVQEKMVNRSIVIRALKLQSMVRRGKISLSNAVEQLSIS